MSADWRRDAAFVAELARAYGQVRDQVGAELLAWHEGRAIGTQEFNRVCASREWRRLEPEPDLACFAELPEAELAQVAYLAEGTLLYDAQIGERPFAPYRDDGAQKLRHLLEKVPAFSLPVPALLQLELGKERLEWPAELLAAIGELRDRTWREASRHLATVYAAENAGAKAAAQVGLSLEDFRFQDDLGLIAPDWREARASLDALSAWYRGELERLARESLRD